MGGASALWLGLDNETRLRGKGISTCATCDGAFFKDKEILVVGGGDEVAEVTGTFDRMRTNLQRTQRELLDAERLATGSSLTPASCGAWRSRARSRR